MRWVRLGCFAYAVLYTFASVVNLLLIVGLKLLAVREGWMVVIVGSPVEVYVLIPAWAALAGTALVLGMVWRER